ncbi:HNH endonuclease signature motif containing protein [Lentisalinibacter sediminis]|uniref:HNH endonuclease signature motif containing protein n=1 Tax=Lentisalinibacter sediminis TaxID=2992237 RepID=UPI00386780EE
MRHRLHGTNRWRRIRITWLTNNPLCVFCEQRGRLTPATVVDHIRPHRGDPVLFFDLTNLQSLCKPCHDSVKQRLERGGKAGSDKDGLPLDPKHHWYR